MGGGTGTGGDDDVVDGEIIGDEKLERGFDPRHDFVLGFNEGRPSNEQMETTGLEREFAALLNKYSREGLSNTPDYILAKFLLDCLSAYEAAVRARKQHAR